MKLVFYGNCQSQAAARALQSRNWHVSCDFSGNSEWVPQFDPERSERLMDEADIIITPWCKMELGLTYPYDLQWFFRGRDLILKLADTYEID